MSTSDTSIPYWCRMLAAANGNRAASVILNASLVPFLANIQVIFVIFGVVIGIGMLLITCSSLTKAGAARLESVTINHSASRRTQSSILVLRTY